MVKKLKIRRLESGKIKIPKIRYILNFELIYGKPKKKNG